MRYLGHSPIRNFSTSIGNGHTNDFHHGTAYHYFFIIGIRRLAIYCVKKRKTIWGGHFLVLEQNKGSLNHFRHSGIDKMYVEPL